MRNIWRTRLRPGARAFRLAIGLVLAATTLHGTAWAAQLAVPSVAQVRRAHESRRELVRGGLEHVIGAFRAAGAHVLLNHAAYLRSRDMHWHVELRPVHEWADHDALSALVGENGKIESQSEDRATDEPWPVVTAVARRGVSAEARGIKARIELVVSHVLALDSQAPAPHESRSEVHLTVGRTHLTRSDHLEHAVILRDLIDHAGGSHPMIEHERRSLGGVLRRIWEVRNGAIEHTTVDGNKEWFDLNGQRIDGPSH